MELTNKKILVVGLGKSGVSVAKFLKKRNASVCVTDMATKDKLGSFVNEVTELGIKVELGAHNNKTFESADLIVLSPGVPHMIMPVVMAKKKGVSVIGEIELASRFIKEPIIAVTGTNGKTTTTTLLGEMLKNSGLRVFVGGNIGNTLIDYLNRGEKADIVVAEISSFQLDTTDTFQPKVGILLNITKDHLDRYPDFNSYAMSKAKIFNNQKTGDTAIINGADTLARAVCKNINSEKLFFNTLDSIEKGAVVNCEQINFNTPVYGKWFITEKDITLSGKHNYENISAAVLAALSVGGTVNGIRKTLKHFKGLSHRLEYVDTVSGVKYFDDSKATNVDAVVRAVESFKESVILIMGGRDKDSDFKKLANCIKGNTKLIIVIGEAAGKIKHALEGFAQIKSAVSMKDAVVVAHKEAGPGDSVILSPACASFDMYGSYAERGNDFCNEVILLKEKII